MIVRRIRRWRHGRRRRRMRDVILGRRLQKQLMGAAGAAATAITIAHINSVTHRGPGFLMKIFQKTKTRFDDAKKPNVENQT